MRQYRLGASLKGSWLVALLAVLWLAMIWPRLTLEVGLYANDSAEYYMRAYGLSVGGGYHPIEEAFPGSGKHASPFVAPPFVPMLLSVPMALFGSTMGVAQIAYYFWQVAAIAGMLFYFRSFLTGTDAALLTLLFLCNPTTVTWFPTIMTDIPYVGAAVVLAAVLYRVTSKEKPGAIRLLLVGVGFGFLVWIRYAGVAWVAAGGLWLVVRAIRSKQFGELRLLVWYTAGVVLPLAALYLWFASYHSTSFTEYYVMYQVDHPDTREMFLKNLLANTRTSIVGYGKHILMNLTIPTEPYRAVKPYLVPITSAKVFVATVFAVFLIVGVWMERRKNYAWFLLCFILVHPLPYMTSKSGPYARYMFPMFFLLWVFAVKGIEHAQRYLGRRWERPSAESVRHGILAFAVLLSLAILYPTSVRCYADGPVAQWPEGDTDLYKASNWIRQRYLEEREPYPKDVVLFVFATEHFTVTAYSGLKIVSFRHFLSEWNSAYIASAIARSERCLIIVDDRWLVTKESAPIRLAEFVGQYRQSVREVFTSGLIRVLEFDPHP